MHYHTSHDHYPTPPPSSSSMFAVSGIQGHLLEITVVGCNKLKDTEWISRQDPYVCLEYGSTKAVLGDEIHFVNILATASEPQSGVDPSSSNEAEKSKIEPLRLPTMEEIKGQDIRNNYDVHSAFSGVMGGRLGLFMGLLLGALDNPLHQEEMTARQQFVHVAKQMGRSISSAKTFAVMGFIFSAAECVVEKARTKHDVTNTVVAGCATGGTLSARGL